VVDGAWLAAHLTEVVVADVRWYLDGRSGRDAYESGHIPTAIWVDLDAVLADPPSPERGRHPLPEPERWAAGLERLGVTDSAPVVAYDDAGGLSAGRLVWMLRVQGHDAALLDGGLAGWAGDLEAGDGRSAASSPPPLMAGRLTVGPWPPDVLAGPDELLGTAATLIDARSPERYRGDTEPMDARSGHIPGAVNVAFTRNLDPATGRWLPPDSLRAIYAGAGVFPGGDVVVYCGSGISACHDLLALERAGLGRGRLYPGSWSQWSADADRPVATGPDDRQG